MGEAEQHKPVEQVVAMALEASLRPHDLEEGEHCVAIDVGDHHMHHL